MITSYDMHERTLEFISSRSIFILDLFMHKWSNSRIIHKPKNFMRVRSSRMHQFKHQEHVIYLIGTQHYNISTSKYRCLISSLHTLLFVLNNFLLFIFLYVRSKKRGVI